MAEAKTDAPFDTSRIDPRFPASALPAIKSMRLSPGDAVTLVNISASGVLVEGKTRFVPGTRLTVIFDGPVKPPQIKARVVRCQVSSIGGGGSLQYQTAIAFEAKIELPVDDSAVPAPPPAVEEPPPPVQKKGKGAAAAVAAAPPRVHNRW